MKKSVIMICCVLSALLMALPGCEKKPKVNPWYNPYEEEPGPQPGPGGDEKTLYNGIVLPQQWPPSGISSTDDNPMSCPWLTSAHPDVIPIDVGRQLFVDDFLIAGTDLVRTSHRPVKYSGNPVFKAESAAETTGSGFAGAAPKDGGIWWDPDEQLFKMWYEAKWLGSMAYATSVDGLQWKRPVLSGGSNIINSVSDLKGNSVSVVLDYDAADGWRYKMFFRQPNAQQADFKGYTMVSKDGINWVSRTKTGYCGDRSTMFYNPFRKKWVFSLRSDDKMGGYNSRIGRARFYYETSDIISGASWTCPSEGKADAVFWCRATKYDQPDKNINIAPQLYNVNAVAYESLMLGWHQILVDENDVAMAAGRPKVTDLKFAFSRDGFNWYRSDYDNAISSARVSGAWDRGYVQSVGGLCAVMGNQLWLWYIGFAGTTGREGESASLHSNMALGLAVLRRDGFASMDGKGSLTTYPVTFKGKYLFVNINCPYGNFTAEVLDEKGNVVPGFEKEKCKPLNVDSTIAQVQWDGKSDLSSLSEKKVCLRFSQDSGEFYSFWVSGSTNGESNGYVAGGGPGFTGNIDTQGLNAYGKTLEIH